jgi:RNA polymerase sigma factor (sigma-70 family)
MPANMDPTGLRGVRAGVEVVGDEGCFWGILCSVGSCPPDVREAMAAVILVGDRAPAPAPLRLGYFPRIVFRPCDHVAVVNPPELDAVALRRPARGLLLDADDAGDAVQEAWLAALRRDPRAEPSQGWLAGAVKRIALGRRRDEARRRARETLAARREPQRAAEDVPERIEVLRALLAALERLDEPYRGAVVMRYLDDLPPREIARRTGVPVDTARTHVRRGLERLRAELDGPRGPGREALLGALVPLTGPLPWKLALASSSSAGGFVSQVGVFAMKHSLFAAVALVALSSGVWIAWHDPAELAEYVATHLDSPSGADVAVSAATGEEPAPMLDGASQRAAVASPPGDAIWTLRGRITVGAWEPLSNGRLVARILRGAGLDGEALHEQTLVADSQGRFTWSLEPPRERVTLTLRGDLPNAVCTTHWSTYAAGDRAWEPWAVRVEPIDLELRGRILGADGRPAAGARVAQRHYEQDLTAVCDAEGRYRLAATSTFEPGTIWASADGFYDKSERFVPPRGGGVLELPDILLAPAGVFGGRVVDEAGTPVAGVEVSTFGTFRRCTVATAEDGRFELPCVQEGAERIHIYFRSAGHPLSHATLPADGSSPDVVLRHGLTLSGRVVGMDGVPIENARIELSDPFGRAGEPFTFSDALGRFSLPHIPAEARRNVWVGANGFAQSFVELDLPPEARSYDVGDLRLAAERVLRGRVLAGDGTPIPWALVSVEDPRLDFPRQGAFARQGTHTDETGRFAFHGLTDASVKVTVLAEDHARLDFEVDEVAATEIVLRPEPAASLAGRVLDAESGEPIRRFRIAVRALWDAPEEHRLTGSTAWHNGVWVESPEGAWKLEDDLAPGAWLGVEVEAEGYAPARLERAVTALDPDPEACRIALVRRTVVRGVVVDRDGVPVAGAAVSLVGQADGPRATTDAAGRFELQGLAAGETTLAVEAEGFARLREGSLDVSGTPRQLRIQLDRGARVIGRVLGDDGQPLAGEQVALCGYDGNDSGVSRKTLSDADGRFTFSGLALGTFDLLWDRTLDGETWTAQSRRVDVTALEDVEANLGASGNAMLLASVQSAVALPAGTRVRVMLLAEPDPKRMRTGGSVDHRFSVAASSRTLFVTGDRFEIRGLEPGLYMLSAHAELGPTTGLNGLVRQIEIAAGQQVEAQVLLELPPPRDG